MTNRYAFDVTVIAPGEGEVVGDASDRRVEILSDHESLHATWSRFGPHRDGADLHVHRHHTDLFYVLEGELTIRLGVEDESVRVPAGTLVCVPPLVVHGFQNGSDADVRYLNLHAPGEGFADFMRGLRDGNPVPFDQHDPPPDGGRPISEAQIGGDVDLEEISVTEVVIEAGGPGWEPPAGRDGFDSFYVLEGDLTGAGPGSWLQFPPGVDRAVAASGADPLRLLNIRTPCDS